MEKNKIKKFLCFFTILITIFNVNFVAFANANEEECEEGKKYGEKLGYYDGILAALDYDSQKKKDLEMPSIDGIIKKYGDDLYDKTNTYKKGFISGYYLGFNKGYEETLKDYSSRNKDKITKYTDFADKLGLLIGEIYGHRDFYSNKQALVNNAMPSDRTLTTMLNLDKLNYQDKCEVLKTFKEKFIEGYEEGYGKVNFEPIRISYEEGITQGEYFGNILGRVSGVNDYFENRTRNYQRDLPRDSYIIRDYCLNNDGERYREGFLIGFRRAYEKSYNENYRTMNVDEHRRSYEEGYEQGKIAGIIKGKMKALEDYHLKLEKHWKRYYPTQSGLVREYSLVIESKLYIEGFFSGYVEGLAEGYGTRFQELSQETKEKKSKVEEIPIDGGEIKSLDESFSLTIDKGTYFNSVIVTLDILPDNYFYVDKGLIKASEFYSINIINKSNEIIDDKAIELKFKYYGKDNGGIYKLVNNKWLYLPSCVEDEYIKTFIKPNSFKEEDNLYCVFVDKKAKPLLDIRNHWGKDEIITYQRRGNVSGYTDNTFKPDEKILKGEFLSLLSKVYNWQLHDENLNFYSSIVHYATDKGYINNLTQSSFKANEGITYKEVETIMRNIIGSKNFNWYNVSSKLLYDKQYKSRSYNNINNYITRAEVVYMLYVLNEWRY